ncbi:MAG: hypothetical protein Q9171_003568 [Xanthocarpia ochracea]
MDHLDFASLSKEEFIKQLKFSQYEVAEWENTIAKRDKLDRPFTMLELLRQDLSVPEKKCPTLLKPWIDFPDQQSNAFQNATEKLSPLGEPLRLFPSTKLIRELGSKKIVRTIASEEDLRYFQHHFAEDYVASIYSQVAPTDNFSNHSHILAEDPEDSDGAPDPPQQVQLRVRGLPPSRKPAGAD